MRLCRFPAQGSRKKRRRKTRRKTAMDRDGSNKVLKLLCGVWKEVIFKKQKIVQTTSSHIL